MMNSKVSNLENILTICMLYTTQQLRRHICSQFFVDEYKVFINIRISLVDEMCVIPTHGEVELCKSAPSAFSLNGLKNLTSFIFFNADDHDSKPRISKLNLYLFHCNCVLCIQLCPSNLFLSHLKFLFLVGLNGAFLFPSIQIP